MRNTWEPGNLAVLSLSRQLVKILVVAGDEVAVTQTTGGRVWWFSATELEAV